MLDFFKNNWIDLLLIFVGALALVIYILQERRKKIDAALLIVSQIDEIKDAINKMSSYMVDNKLNQTAFYEMLPIMSENYWSKYKHYFVGKMDARSYFNINQSAIQMC